MLTVTNELLPYINIRSFYYIMVIIEVDAGRVEIKDSLNKKRKEYQMIIDVLQR